MRSRSANRPPARKPALIGAGRGVTGPAEGETHRQQDVPSYHQAEQSYPLDVLQAAELVRPRQAEEQNLEGQRDGEQDAGHAAGRKVLDGTDQGGPRPPVHRPRHRRAHDGGRR